MYSILQWVIVAIVIILAAVLLFRKSKNNDCCDCPLDKTCKKRRHRRVL